MTPCPGCGPVSSFFLSRLAAVAASPPTQPLPRSLCPLPPSLPPALLPRAFLLAPPPPFVRRFLSLSFSLSRVRSFFRASEARRIITVTSRGHFRRGKREEEGKGRKKAMPRTPKTETATPPPLPPPPPPLLSGNFSSFPASTEAPRSPSLALFPSLHFLLLFDGSLAPVLVVLCCVPSQAFHFHSRGCDRMYKK